VKTVQGFESSTLKRSQIRLFEMNPRVMDASARRKLKAILKDFKLVMPLVVNRQTGNTLVGGHQRLDILDEEQKYNPDDPATDYDVPVALVDQPPEKEKALVIALNNPSTMGSWDSVNLGKLFTDKENPIDIKATGFDQFDLQTLLDGRDFAKLFANTDVGAQAAAEAPIIDQLSAFKDAGNDAKKATAQAKNQVEELKQRRIDYPQEVAGTIDQNFHIIFVGNSREQCVAFLEAAGLDSTAQMLPLDDLARALGIDLYPEEESADESPSN